MEWYWIVVALALAGIPYAFFLFKFAAAGWLAGLRSYVKTTQRKVKD